MRRSSNDPAARVLDGIDERTAVFVNSPLTAEQFQVQTSLSGRLTALDLTDIALQQFGKRGAISALLGAVAGRLVGLRQESIREAIARELADLGLAASVIEHNQTMAAQCYDAVRPVSVVRRLRRRRSPRRSFKCRPMNLRPEEPPGSAPLQNSVLRGTRRVANLPAGAGAGQVQWLLALFRLLPRRGDFNDQGRQARD